MYTLVREIDVKYVLKRAFSLDCKVNVVCASVSFCNEKKTVSRTFIISRKAAHDIRCVLKMMFWKVGSWKYSQKF